MTRRGMYGDVVGDGFNRRLESLERGRIEVVSGVAVPPTGTAIVGEHCANGVAMVVDGRTGLKRIEIVDDVHRFQPLSWGCRPLVDELVVLLIEMAGALEPDRIRRFGSIGNPLLRRDTQVGPLRPNRD